MSINSYENRVSILLAFQSALLGMVSSTMRAVIVSWTQDKVKGRIIFDKILTETNIERASEIETEVMSHLPDHEVICRAELCTIDRDIEHTEKEVFVFCKDLELQ